MSTTQTDDETLSRHNTRCHWAMYALDKWENDRGRETGATADDIWKLVGGEDSIVWTSRADAGSALRQAYDKGFCQRRSMENDWEGPILIAYRLTKTGARALRDAGKPEKLPNRHAEGYDRELPVDPEYEPTGVVLGHDTPEEDAEDDWLREAVPAEDWVDTEYAHVYLRDEGAQGLIDSPTSLVGYEVVDAAGEVAEAFHDGWTIVVDVGPYRAHDVGYRVDPETKRIHLDYYSVRPGTQFTEAIIRGITRDLKQLDTDA